MTQEDIVPFEIAKKLKEKRFREECVMYYTPAGSLYSCSIDTYDRPNQELDYSDFQKSFNNGIDVGFVDAPTISQVLKWLRKRKNIYISVSYIPEIEENEGNYYYPTIQYIGSFNPTIYTNANDNFDNYEEAAVAGIEYVLDNLI